MRVTRLGYAPKDKKWYGWSHRAIFGFTIGSKVEKGHCAYIPATFIELMADCHCRKSNDDCHANAHYLIIDEKPDGELIMGDKLEGVQRCLPENCVFETGKGEWTAETIDDAKQMAIDFAASVS